MIKPAMKTRLQEVSELSVLSKSIIADLLVELETLSKMSAPARIDFESKFYFALEKYVQYSIEAFDLTKAR